MAIEERVSPLAQRLGSGGPFLDPDRWTARHRRFVLIGAVVVVIAWLVEAVAENAANGTRAAIGAALAVAVAGFALSLRGVTWSGLAVGGFVVFCGIMSWTWTTTRAVTWSVYALGALLLLLWTFPWFRDAIRLPRLGAAWLGLAYWPLGIISAILTASWTVGGQRVAYFGVSAVAALGIIVALRRTGRDPSIGVVTAFLFAIAALFLVGSGNILDDVHAVPEGAWGARMTGRFWGGPGLLYHPNSLALIGVLISLRIAPDRSFARWQRGAALGLTGLVILLTNSRTAWLFLACAAGVHLLVVARKQWWARRGAVVPDDGLPHYPSVRRAVLAAVLPFVLVGMVFIGMGGVSSLFQSRYQDPGTTPATENETADITSGRVDTWKQVIDEFEADAIVAKLFGNNSDPRGAVVREDTGVVGERPELTTDNSAIGALRRAGILGCIAFLFGLGLLLWRALRRGVPAWFTIAVVASLATIPWADWLLGGVGGTFWIFLLAAEAWIVLGPAAQAAKRGPTVPSDGATPPVPSPAGPPGAPAAGAPAPAVAPREPAADSFTR
ncbi:O-antigen ligase family protein [Cryptosporangium aurantiacum]|uniref:O-Antigen ligase n=1 Tax=Cryptosporangium aurantiacum TaxID=134849 RepID=A0A1M7QXR8_9ACTN|nr:O-antigen ligase family protein [Cryptosporangium aurantiacum]SHN36525.1 O-Antigen ligase [Cryptosporangium aurantiacum]